MMHQIPTWRKAQVCSIEGLKKKKMQCSVRQKPGWSQTAGEYQLGFHVWYIRKSEEDRLEAGQTPSGDLTGGDRDTICEPNLAMTCLGLCQHP